MDTLVAAGGSGADTGQHGVPHRGTHKGGLTPKRGQPRAPRGDGVYQLVIPGGVYQLVIPRHGSRSRGKRRRTDRNRPKNSHNESSRRSPSFAATSRRILPSRPVASPACGARLAGRTRQHGLPSPWHLERWPDGRVRRSHGGAATGSSAGVYSEGDPVERPSGDTTRPAGFGVYAERRDPPVIPPAFTRRYGALR